MPVIAIAAMTPTRVIGRDGTIPWHLTEDLRFFKRTTLGHIVLMGRKTFDSIGKPLPGRENWVLTRGPAIQGTRCFSSPSDIVPPKDGRQIFVIGGAAVYELFLPQCQELFLTLLHQNFSGDTFFPAWEKEFAPTDLLLETSDFVIRRFIRSRPSMNTQSQPCEGLASARMAGSHTNCEAPSEGGKIAPANSC